MTIQPTTERVFPVLNDNDEVTTYAKELVFKLYPYSLVIRYFAEDGKSFDDNDHYVIIASDEKKMHVRLLPVKRVDIGASGYNVDVEVPSNQAETVDELRNLAGLLEATANAKELFQKVLDERF